MTVNFKAWLFHSGSFCCCIPVRAGFVLISILTFLLSGTISAIIWFEIFHSYQLSTNERVAFILTGVVESILFVVSIIGFIGVVARKQLFVMIYTYFLYVHFAINLVVGIYFLVTVGASDRQQLVDYCAQVFVDTSMESSCLQLMAVSIYVFIAIVAALLLLELYGVLIATRYVYHLRIQKRDGRSRRLGYFHALSKPETLGSGHTRQASDNIELLHSQENPGDPQDLEDAVFDIGPPRYMAVSTHDRDLPPVPASSSSLLSPPYSSWDTTSGRRIRALPPRPVDNTASPVISRASSRSQEEEGVARLPDPHGPLNHASREREPQPPDSEDEQHSQEVSTNAHSALIAHAKYMESMIFNDPLPNRSQQSLP